MLDSEYNLTCHDRNYHHGYDLLPCGGKKMCDLGLKTFITMYYMSSYLLIYYVLGLFLSLFCNL